MRRTLTPMSRALLVGALLLAGARNATAQLVEVPPFLALDWTYDVRYGSPSVAAAADSSMLVLASRNIEPSDKRHAVTQRFSASGSPLGTVVRIDDTADVSLPYLIADTRGGFLASWRRSGPFLNLPLVTTPLGPTGTPMAPTFQVAAGPTLNSASAALPSGAVFVWRDSALIKGQRLDVAGQPSGPLFTIRVVEASPRFLSVTAKSDGGFVVAWSEDDHGLARVYDAGGAPLGDVLDLAPEFVIQDVAASPLGGFVAVGRRTTDTHAWRSGVWARRFDDGGTASGPSFLVGMVDPAMTAWPQAACDTAGRLYVVWGIQAAAPPPPQGRVYDPSGLPLHAPFRLIQDQASQVHLATRPDGRFIEGWTAIGGDFTLQVRTPCVPPHHVGCGNGVVEAPCERCDAGPANSDVTPDACRTTCALPACGDGVVDQGESCDDGNLIGCDGCDSECALEVGYVCGDGIVSADCEEQCDDGPGNDDTLPNACRTTCLRAHCSDGVRDDGEACDDANRVSCDGCSDLCVAEPGLVCGDGIPELRCGEQCDDGNATVGDGCTEPCRLERVPGSGSPAGDCKIEWVVDNPTNVPLYDKHGAISGAQVCRDGDPRCDFDGGVAGSCTFHVRVCANNTDLPDCAPGPRLRSWELRAPSATKAAKRPELAAVRAAFTTVPGAIIGPTLLDVCSGTLAVPIPVRTYATGVKAGSLVLKSYATLYTGEKDSDKLKLVCQP